MFHQIVTFLFDVVGGLLTGACLLRLYMQLHRIPFANPVGQMVFALSDWLVMPLRRAVPAVGRWDMSCVVAAVLLQLAQYTLLWMLFGSAAQWMSLLWLALFGLMRTALSGLIGVLLVSAVLSWVQTRSPIADVVQRLSEPLLRPLRRVVPQVSGLDLSPLVALVLLQIAMMVLGHLQAALMWGGRFF